MSEWSGVSGVSGSDDEMSSSSSSGGVSEW